MDKYNDESWIAISHYRRFWLKENHEGIISPDNLNSNIKRFTSTPRSKQSYYVYCVKVENRELIRDKLLHLGIHTGIHYPYPIHLMDAYNFLNYKEGSLPFTEKLCDTVLSLPIYPSLEDDEVNFICESLNQIIQNS